VAELIAWRISGTYLESCNCDAICPCRRIDGKAGGRSTHGECLGALSWQITEGSVGELDLAGMRVVMATAYSDDEERSPWTFVLYVDARASEEQRAALEQIYTGALGGTPLEQFPWAFKPSFLLRTEAATIEIDHTPGKGWFRAADQVEVRVRAPVQDDAIVTCIIPGHHRSGREVVAHQLAVSAAEALTYEYTGVCGYEATFEYSSAASAG
jgi:hypothetical protein